MEFMNDYIVAGALHAPARIEMYSSLRYNVLGVVFSLVLFYP